MLNAYGSKNTRVIQGTDLALGSNNANGLMARDEWELGDKLSLVDVLGSPGQINRSTRNVTGAPK